MEHGSVGSVAPTTGSLDPSLQTVTDADQTAESSPDSSPQPATTSLNNLVTSAADPVSAATTDRAEVVPDSIPSTPHGTDRVSKASDGTAPDNGGHTDDAGIAGSDQTAPTTAGTTATAHHPTANSRLMSKLHSVTKVGQRQHHGQSGVAAKLGDDQHTSLASLLGVSHKRGPGPGKDATGSKGGKIMGRPWSSVVKDPGVHYLQSGAATPPTAQITAAGDASGGSGTGANAGSADRRPGGPVSRAGSSEEPTVLEAAAQARKVKDEASVPAAGPAPASHSMGNHPGRVGQAGATNAAPAGVAGNSGNTAAATGNTVAVVRVGEIFKQRERGPAGPGDPDRGKTDSRIMPGGGVGGSNFGMPGSVESRELDGSRWGRRQGRMAAAAAAIGGLKQQNASYGFARGGQFTAPATWTPFPTAPPGATSVPGNSVNAFDLSIEAPVQTSGTQGLGSSNNSNADIQQQPPLLGDAPRGFGTARSEDRLQAPNLSQSVPRRHVSGGHRQEPSSMDRAQRSGRGAGSAVRRESFEAAVAGVAPNTRSTDSSGHILMASTGDKADIRTLSDRPSLHVEKIRDNGPAPPVAMAIWRYQRNGREQTDASKRQQSDMSWRSTDERVSPAVGVAEVTPTSPMSPGVPIEQSCNAPTDHNGPLLRQPQFLRSSSSSVPVGVSGQQGKQAAPTPATQPLLATFTESTSGAAAPESAVPGTVAMAAGSGRARKRIGNLAAVSSWIGTNTTYNNASGTAAVSPSSSTDPLAPFGADGQRGGATVRSHFSSVPPPSTAPPVLPAATGAVDSAAPTQPHLHPGLPQTQPSTHRYNNRDHGGYGNYGYRGHHSGQNQPGTGRGDVSHSGPQYQPDFYTRATGNGPGANVAATQQGVNAQLPTATSSLEEPVAPAVIPVPGGLPNFVIGSSGSSFVNGLSHSGAPGPLPGSRGAPSGSFAGGSLVNGPRNMMERQSGGDSLMASPEDAPGVFGAARASQLRVAASAPTIPLDATKYGGGPLPHLTAIDPGYVSESTTMPRDSQPLSQQSQQHPSSRIMQALRQSPKQTTESSQYPSHQQSSQFHRGSNRNGGSQSQQQAQQPPPSNSSPMKRMTHQSTQGGSQQQQPQQPQQRGQLQPPQPHQAPSAGGVADNRNSNVGSGQQPPANAPQILPPSVTTFAANGSGQAPPIANNNSGFAHHAYVHSQPPPFSFPQNAGGPTSLLLQPPPVHPAYSQAAASEAFLPSGGIDSRGPGIPTLGHQGAAASRGDYPLPGASEPRQIQGAVDPRRFLTADAIYLQGMAPLDPAAAAGGRLPPPQPAGPPLQSQHHNSQQQQPSPRHQHSRGLMRNHSKGSATSTGYPEGFESVVAVSNGGMPVAGMAATVGYTGWLDERPPVCFHPSLANPPHLPPDSGDPQQGGQPRGILPQMQSSHMMSPGAEYMTGPPHIDHQPPHAAQRGSPPVAVGRHLSTAAIGRAMMVGGNRYSAQPPPQGQQQYIPPNHSSTHLGARLHQQSQ